jgi:hypothetical protein
MIRAECDECGKSYKVADAAKTYRCTACGGRVRAAPAPYEAPPEPDITVSTPPCPSCDAPNPEDARFCEQCGAPLETGPAAAHVPPRARRRRGDAVDRDLVNRELGRAYRTAQAVRAFYVACLVVIAVRLALLVWVIASEPDLAADLAILTGAATLDLVLFLTGYLRILRNPFFWTVLVASVTTLNFAIGIVDYGALGFFNLAGLFTVALWAAVPATARVRKLMKKYPDLWVVARRFRGERSRAPRGAVSAHARQRGREARTETLRKAALFGGIPAVLLIAAFVLYRNATRPPSIEDITPALMETTARFAESWNRSDTYEIASYFQPSSRDRMHRAIGSRVKRRGWEGSHPPVEPPRLDRVSGTTARVLFLPRGGNFIEPLKTVWKYRDGHWDLTSIRYPE